VLKRTPDLLRSLANRLWGAVALVGLLSAAPAAAASEPAPLPYGRVLERLSFKLRGVAPTADERAAFVAAAEADPTRFPALYAETIDRYLAAPEFRGVVEELHAVWWRVRRAESTALAGYIVANDRRYDELFAKDYLYVDGAHAPAYANQRAAVQTPLPSNNEGWRAVRLAPTETRFRSLLSQQDFLNTFPDTPTNKNRKRASQVFHTFLCETLTPSAPQPPLDPTAPTDPDDPHGHDPNCVGCHYRLDPLARFFDHWRPPLAGRAETYFDPAVAAAGTLILLNPDGSRTSASGAGESALGRVLASEPRFHACAVQQIWSYLFGPSVALDAPTSASLVQALERRGNFKDAVKLAAQHPYFWSNEVPPPPRFADVKAYFGVCTSCHAPDGVNDPRFDPTRYPFAADAATNADWLTRIWGAINYAIGYVPMPLAPTPALPADALARIRAWIAAGAVDDALRPTLDAAQVARVLGDD
jgi:hypothetical protein